jgi:hypothetical protein
MELAHDINAEPISEPLPPPPPPARAVEEKSAPSSRDKDEWRNYTPDLSFLRRKSRSSTKPEETGGQESPAEETSAPSDSEVNGQEPAPLASEPTENVEESPAEPAMVESDAETSSASVESAIEPHPSSQPAVSSAAALSSPENQPDRSVAAYPPAGDNPEARPWDMDRFADDLRHM